MTSSIKDVSEDFYPATPTQEIMQAEYTVDQFTPRDALVYFVFFMLIVGGFTLVPSGWLEKITASTSSDTLRAFGISANCAVQGEEAFLTLFGGDRPVMVTIIRECTAINVFSVMAGLIIPLRRASWARKTLGVIFSGVVLFLMNVSRITLTVFLTGFDVPPFSWYFTSPTIEVYHYPISFMYGVIGVALLVLMVNRWILPELGYTLLGVSESVSSLVKRDDRSP